MTDGLQSAIGAFQRKQAIASFLALVLILLLSVVYNFLHLSAQAEQAVKLISRMVQVNDRREVVLTLQQARLDHFQTIRYISEDARKSFTLPEVAELAPARSSWSRFVTEEVEISVDEPGERGAVVRFAFNRFSYFPHGFVIWLILNLVSLPQTMLMRRKMVAQYRSDLTLEKERSRLEVARTVRHNIRTPLSALLRLSGTIQFARQTESEIFHSTIEQIENLIAKLDGEKSAIAENVSSGFFDTMRLAIQEVRMTVPSRIVFDVAVDELIPSARVLYAAPELRSIIANLVNNACEAIHDHGRIELRVRDTGYSVELTVVDDGIGIPEEILARVTENGFSYGKAGGSGVGLFHAKNMIEAWRGKLAIESVPHQGTTVKVSLPIEGRQPWYVSRVKIPEKSTVIIVDDQVLVHRLWGLKLSEAGFTGTVRTFFNAEELRSSMTSEELAGAICFVDYDMGCGLDGVETLKQMPMAAQRFLVTGHCDDSEVRASCEEFDLGLIPKPELSSLPIVIAG